MMEKENKDMDQLIREHMRVHERNDFAITAALFCAAAALVFSILSIVVVFTFCLSK